MRLNPQNVDAHRALAYAFNVQGKYRESIAAYTEAIAVHPRLARLYYELGLNHSALSNYDQAIEHYRQAIAINPTYAVAYDALGWAYYYQDDPERAIIELERAVAMDPENVEASAHLGMALYRRQRYEDAVAPLEKAVTLLMAQEKRVNEAYLYTLGLSYIYGEPRNCEAAVPWLEEALALNPFSQPALVGLQTCSQ